MPFDMNWPQTYRGRGGCQISLLDGWEVHLYAIISPLLVHSPSLQELTSKFHNKCLRCMFQGTKCLGWVCFVRLKATIPSQQNVLLITHGRTYVHDWSIYGHCYVQLGCLCEYVASLPMHITSDQKQITKTYNFLDRYNNHKKKLLYFVNVVLHIQHSVDCQCIIVGHLNCAY